MTERSLDELVREELASLGVPVHSMRVDDDGAGTMGRCMVRVTVPIGSRNYAELYARERPPRGPEHRSAWARKVAVQLAELYKKQVAQATPQKPLTRADILALVFEAGEGVVQRATIEGVEAGVLRIMVVGSTGKLFADHLREIEEACRGVLPDYMQIELTSASPQEAKDPDVKGGAKRLLVLAELYPWEVLENPLLDLVSMEDPLLWNDIQRRAAKAKER